MICKLADICYYVKDKIDVGALDENTYISTENMLPNKEGVTTAASLPPTEQTQAFSTNDVLVSNIRPYFKKLWQAEYDGGCSNDVLVLRASENCDSTYLYYVLANDAFFDYAMVTSKGTKMPRGDKRAIMEYAVPMIDIRSQQKIGKFLRCIDKKIAVNKKINNNLQQVLFASYTNIVANSAFLHEVQLSSLCSFQEGYVNPSQTHSEYFDGEIKWLRAVDINESFITETSRTLTKVGFESAKKSALLFKPNTIAISKSGTIGRLGIIADYMCGNRAVINISPYDANMLPFVYCFLKSKQSEFPNMAVGSIQKNLYVSLLEPIIVALPDEKTLAAFNVAGTAILNAIKNNCVENGILRDLRDTLLPRLLSGQVDVSKIEN